MDDAIKRVVTEYKARSNDEEERPFAFGFLDKAVKHHLS